MHGKYGSSIAAIEKKKKIEKLPVQRPKMIKDVMLYEKIINILCIAEVIDKL